MANIKKVYVIMHPGSPIAFIHPENPHSAHFLHLCKEEDQLEFAEMNVAGVLEEAGYVEVEVVEYTPKD